MEELEDENLETIGTCTNCGEPIDLSCSPVYCIDCYVELKSLRDCDLYPGESEELLEEGDE